MKVLVDTCVWSLALRRKNVTANHYVDELKNLIEEVRVQFIGPIRQELLGGIKSEPQFVALAKQLDAFTDAELEVADYVLAAKFFNTARKSGIQGSSTDFLICAVAVRRNLPILTTDKDFTNYQAVIPIVLHKLRD